MPTKRAATYEENIEQKELIQTVTSKKSSIVTPKTYALTMTQKEIDNIKRIADEKKIRLYNYKRYFNDSLKNFNKRG